MKWFLGVSLLLAMPAGASSPQAWAAGNAAARRACLAVAGLRGATASEPILFSDRVGQTGFVIEGIYPQRHMKGARGTFLCLYDRRAKRAEVAEMPAGVALRSR